MNRAFKFAVWGLAPFFMYALGALIGPLIPVGQQDEFTHDLDIGLVAGPIHYDILIPLSPHLSQEFEFLIDAGVPLEHPQAEWLVVGWGSRGFYTHTSDYAQIPIATVVRAMTGDTSVLRFDVAGALPETANVKYVPMSVQMLDQLIADLKSEMGGQTPLDVTGFTSTDVFYPAQTRFHIFRTCNVWIGRTLRRIGVRFGLWTPIPLSVTIAHGLWI